jgi:hypothetical protein
MPTEVPFLPQLGITQQILEGIQLANQQKADQQANAARQRQLDVAQQEANTASQRLQVESPYYAAQAAHLLTESQLQAQAMACNQAAQDYLTGNSGHGSEPHIAAVVGQNHAYGVPLEPPAALNISNPLGATLAQPSAPSDSTVSGTPAVATQAQGASPEQGSSLVGTSATPAQTQSTPVQATQPQGGVYADIAEVGRRIGGFTDQENQLVQHALTEARLNANPYEALSKLQTDLQAIVAHRSQPEYALQVSLQKQGYSEQAAIAISKRNLAATAQLDKIAVEPAELAGDKASVAKGSLQELAADRTLTLENREKALRLSKVAAIAEQNQLQADAAKKKFEQAAKDGDPRAAAQLLLDGVVAPSQLISVRNPDFATKAFSAASKLGRERGEVWSAQKAQGDFNAAQSPANLTFFGPAKSMVEKGGTLDQLEAAAKNIPNGQIPFFNSLADAQKAALGDGPIAKYAAIALGVADDYSKITGGGGSDTSREQALHLLPTNASPAARKGSLEGIRGTVNSQIHSRIGSNKVLASMYGDGLTQSAPEATASSVPTGATHTGVSSVDGKTYYLDANNNKLGEVK